MYQCIVEALKNHNFSAKPLKPRAKIWRLYGDGDERQRIDSGVWYSMITCRES